MLLRDWLDQEYRTDAERIDACRGMGARIVRCLADAWDGGLGWVHGALTLHDIEVDATGRVRVHGLSSRGDRVAHQGDLQQVGRVLYALIMGETAGRYGPPRADRVAAVLHRMEASSFRRPRQRIQAAHPGVGRIIARLLITDGELGFSDGWAAAAAFEALGSDGQHVGSSRTAFPTSVDDPSDETFFVALVRTADSGACVPLFSDPQSSRPGTPSLPVPALVHARHGPDLHSFMHRMSARRWVSVGLFVGAIWMLGLTMGAAVLWHHWGPAQVVQVAPQAPLGAPLDQRVATSISSGAS